MKKKWVLLFNLNKRVALQDSLNQICQKYEVHSVRVWTDREWENPFFASVLYSYPERDKEAQIHRHVQHWCSQCNYQICDNECQCGRWDENLQPILGDK